MAKTGMALFLVAMVIMLARQAAFDLGLGIEFRRSGGNLLLSALVLGALIGSGLCLIKCIVGKNDPKGGA